MKAAELDTKDVTVTRTEKRYILNESVFELDECPDWAQYAAVDADGEAYWYSVKPSRVESDWVDFYGRIRLIRDGDNPVIFDATDWQVYEFQLIVPDVCHAQGRKRGSGECRQDSLHP